MKPTNNAVGIENRVTDYISRNRINAIATLGCIFCNNPDTNFRDQLSIKEYKITGICQKCQDNLFLYK
ncbi:MAG: hypothetical protein AABY07_10235 [Nanoarchaeota archaeon]